MSYQDEVEASRQKAVARFWEAVDAAAPDPANAVRMAAELVGDKTLDPGRRRKLDGDLRLLRARLEARRQIATVELAEDRHYPHRGAVKASLARYDAGAKVTMAILENASKRNRAVLEHLTERVAGKRISRSPLPVLRAIARSSCECGCRGAAQEWLDLWARAKTSAENETGPGGGIPGRNQRPHPPAVGAV